MDWIGRLVHLEELNLLTNEVQILPKAVGQLEKLKQLEMTWNRLKILEDGARVLSLADEQWAHPTVRDQICAMSSLQVLKLSCAFHNEFPKDWSKMVNLQQLNIFVMELKEPPLWLNTLPNLQRLSFRVHYKKEKTAELIKEILADRAIEIL